MIQAPRREHSRKPDELYAIIERAYPELPKIELFARHARPGWSAWGDEAPSATQTELEELHTLIGKAIVEARARGLLGEEQP